MDHIVHTRPERTTDEIRADQHSADAFFARFDSRTTNPNRVKDNRRIAEREAHDYKILMAAKEGSEWAGRHNKTAIQRREQAQERFVADPLSHRDDTKLRPYVHPAVRAAMPAPRLHQRLKQEVDQSNNEAASWRYQARNWPKEWGEMKIRQSSVPFEHWLLTHPTYGVTNENAPIVVTRDEMRRSHYLRRIGGTHGALHPRELQHLRLARNADARRRRRMAERRPDHPRRGAPRQQPAPPLPKRRCCSGAALSLPAYHYERWARTARLARHNIVSRRWRRSTETRGL
jgi:hypothetical protein